MFQQVVRQGLRAVAIYFSDVLLWLSVAGLAEVLFVLFAGVLCILTAGFIFEGMKKSPVVMVLGCLVALGGTFLMFREVRGLIWPADEAAPSREAHAAPVVTPPPPPTTATLPSPGTPIVKPSSPCFTRSRTACAVNSDCEWSETFRICSLRAGGVPRGGTGTFSSPTVPPADSFCGSLSKYSCTALKTSCYWSPLTKRCEKLLFGDTLFLRTEKKPSQTDCLARKSRTECWFASGCIWLDAEGTCTWMPAGQGQ